MSAQTPFKDPWRPQSVCIHHLNLARLWRPSLTVAMNRRFTLDPSPNGLPFKHLASAPIFASRAQQYQ
jgi:hypothetical protein